MHIHSVVIATCNRTNLLARALKSVAAQHKKPDHIVVIDDSTTANIDGIRGLGDTLGLRLEVLANRRTKGASGAWNTGLDHLARHKHVPQNHIISILDDDDWWDPKYLQIVSQIAETGAEVVAGTICRYDEQTPKGRLLLPPETLSCDAFLVGNPGIQGSNLTAKLSTLLEAGLFDESLSSCTDRDICIRLADLCAGYRTASGAVIHHDCLHGKARLSDVHGEAKRNGLEAFHAKWRMRMTPAQYKASTARALELFAWTPADEPNVADTVSPISISCPQNPDPLQLVIGIVVDGNIPERCRPLIDGLAKLSAHSLVQSIDLVLLENGKNAGFMSISEQARRLGMNLWPIGMAEQHNALSSLPLVASDINRNKPIAVARTLLQPFVFEVSQQARDGATAWILDDDFRLPNDLDELVTAMIACRDGGIDVVLGGNSGSAPVPASSVLRTQLLDLVHLLTWTSKRQPEDTFPNAESTNRRWLSGRHDVHYDLSRRESDRLETPFLPPLLPTTLVDGVSQMMRRAERILAGEPVTRLLPEMQTYLLDDAPPSCWRGGNTLIFDTALLRDIPNMAPRVDGRPVRRSDMIWTANALYRFGKKVIAFRLPMSHDRTTEKADGNDTQRLVDDIIGYGFFTAYEEVIKKGVGSSPLTIEQRARILRLTHKYATERLAAYRLSFWRALGLIRTLKNLMTFEPWWYCDADYETRSTFDRFLQLLNQSVTLQRFQEIETRIESGLQRGRFREFLSDMDRIQPSEKVIESSFFRDWVRAGREAQARLLVANHLMSEDLELLGMGDEGVVLRAGQRVLKVYDRWTPAKRRTTVPLLLELMENPTNTALPTLLAIHDWPNVFAVEYRFEDSEPFEGGRAPELVDMLRDLRRSGWVHTNICPKNLRITRRGLQLIDVGKSLQRATLEGEEVMIRRAFLSWRFAKRSDLATLMRASIANEFLPELTGWRALLEATAEPSPKIKLDQFIHNRVDAHSPQTFLDYGCGKPRGNSQRTGDRQVTVFDVDPTLAERWRLDAPKVRYWDTHSLKTALSNGETFDVILCSLVLCTLDDHTLSTVLKNLWQLAGDKGHLIIAVCDPTAIHIAQTVYQTRCDTAACDPALPTVYRKSVNGSTILRKEHHRSLEAYRRAFAKAGLRVIEESIISGFDTQRLERAPEFVVFELVPLPALPVRTSLLIKLCAMEAETALYQVRHLERQLARPRAFDEVVVLIDPHEGPFPRAHSAANLSGLRAAIARLQAEGVVDRVLEGFTDGMDSNTAAELWTGCSAPLAHCANGQPATAILAAIENCTGDYILHMDADVLIARPDETVDHIADAVRVFEQNANAVTLALSVYGDIDLSPRCKSPDGMPYRVEAICGWVSKERLIALRPLNGGTDAGRLALPWHRMIDLAVRDGRATSLRCGSRALWFTSLDNLRKSRKEVLDLIMGRVEACQAPNLQNGRPLVAGTLTEWLEPKRHESMVVIICGRNVRPGRVERCFTSLRIQSDQNWGAIVMDDASDEPWREAIRRACLPLGDRVTLIRRNKRVGLLANTTLAVRELVQSTDSIIVLLDLDDALADPQALSIVAATHAQGADLTVGSMVRTDKETFYPVDFSDPRGNRGGNVWQHLRTFRKSLFDRIRISDFKINGDWIDLANDWAYMLPLVEIAKKPTWLRQKLYLHEPSTSRHADERAARENIISQIVAKPSYRGHTMPTPQVTVLCYHRILDQIPSYGPDAMFFRRGMAVTVATMQMQLADALRVYEPIRIGDLLAAQRGERSLPDQALLVTIDDGYRDFASHGHPLLLKAGIEPILFARQPVTDGIPNWAPLDLLYIGRGLAGEQKPLPNKEWRMRLLEMPIATQVKEVERAIGMEISQLEQVRRALYLSEAELRSLPGVALGTHGIDHVRWTNLDDATLYKMFGSCRSWLQSMGVKSLVAAYPDGAMDDRVASCLARYGFEAAFAINPPIESAVSAFALTRTIMGNDPDQLSRSVVDT
jgi:glycosyltransferase involved in cell wall biosynthesis/peptidoglycan/xylan/chitin deacetylase (PgdA/CDA1 family)